MPELFESRIWSLIKFIYSDKATKIWRNVQTLLTAANWFNFFMKITYNLSGLLRTQHMNFTYTMWRDIFQTLSLSQIEICVNLKKYLKFRCDFIKSLTPFGLIPNSMTLHNFFFLRLSSLINSKQWYLWTPNKLPFLQKNVNILTVNLLSKLTYWRQTLKTSKFFVVTD